MFIRYEQITISTARVYSVNDLSPNPLATSVMLQAASANIRYTMDGTPPTTAIGMLLLTTSEPEMFLMEDFKRIKFIAASGTPTLNIHYSGPGGS